MDDVKVTLDQDIEKKVADLVIQGDASIVVALKIVDAARSLAPVESGDYRAGIKAQRTKGGARVLSTDFKSTWIEFGAPSRNLPARWILRSAAESLGLTFKKRKG
jgi:hypothetical protein